MTRISAKGKRAALNVVAGLTLGFCASAAQAQEFGASYDYVYKVQVNGNDNLLYIGVAGSSFLAGHGCPQPWFAVSAYPISDDRTKAWMQLAIASMVSRTPIYIHNKGCTAYGHLIMDQVQLQVEK